MMTSQIILTQNFSPVGNVLVMAISILLFLLISDTFNSRDLSFRLFCLMLGLCLFATMTDQCYVVMKENIDAVPDWAIYITRYLYHAILFINLFVYLYYITRMLLIPQKQRVLVLSLGGIVVVSLLVWEALTTSTYAGFRIENGVIIEGFNVFAIAYSAMTLIILGVIIWHRSRVISQVFKGIIATYIICIVLLGIQGIFGHSSFTTAVFLLPVITLLYLIHSNPYDLTTGAVNESSFYKVVENASRTKSKFMLLSLQSDELDHTLNISPELRFEIFHFFSSVTKRGVLFRLSGNRLILYFPIKYNPNPWDTVEKLEHQFAELYKRFKLNFRVVVMESNPILDQTNEYTSFLSFIERGMPLNTYYHVKKDDITKYTKEQFIIGQLEDIAKRGDLDDERVLTYCQPVYNVNTEKYDTAEALMRLRLPGVDFVYPDVFIPLAEKNGFIHSLSLIILNKTCGIVRKFLDWGLYINRISVNFSITELRSPDFSTDIIKIIEKNSIPYDKIAIEITESKNETDFDIIKERIKELHEYGIKFYLDDFGTGYSNFDRIMELPFDIIKFDRSLVIESGKNQNSEYMVGSFAGIFHKLNYKVLYEGIENKTDEERCIKMQAQYLQGFKYSKPIPIEMLADFLSAA